MNIDFNKISIITIDYEVFDGEKFIKYVNYDNPIKFVEPDILNISKEYYENNKEQIITYICNICKMTINPSLTIVDNELITSEVINALSNNKNIKTVTLGCELYPHCLTKDEYLKFKKNNIKVITHKVDDELANINDGIINYNMNQNVLGKYTMGEIISNSVLYLNSNELEQLKNLLFLFDLNLTIKIDFEDDNLYDILNTIMYLDDNGFIGKFHLIIDKIDEKLELLMKSNKEQILKLKNFYIQEQDKLISAEKLINTINIVDAILDKIKDLSNFEKFIYIYNYVKQVKKYKESNDSDKDYNVYEVLDKGNDSIVCAGFGNLLEYILNKAGINSYAFHLDVDAGLDNVPLNLEPLSEYVSLEKNTHKRVLVNLIDKKYNLNGYYISDPTWDNDLENDYYNYALTTYNEALNSSRYEYYDRNSLIELLFCKNLDEFYLKVNYLLDSKHFNKSTEYNLFFKEVLSLFNRFDIDFEKKIKSTFGDISSLYRKFSITEIQNIMLFIGEYILTKNDNRISGQTLKNGILKLYKDVYRVDDSEEIVDYIFAINAKRQFMEYPTRIIDRLGDFPKVLCNGSGENKFENLNYKKR